MPKVTSPRTDRLRGYATEFGNGIFPVDRIENNFDRTAFSAAYTSGKQAILNANGFFEVF